MLKKLRFFPLIIGLLVWISGCGTTDKMEYYDKTASTNLSENINTISVDTPAKVVGETLGNPISVESNNQSSEWKYGEDKKHFDLEFRIMNGKVNRYFFASNNYTTTKGITIGSSKEDVIQKYGKNYYEREDTGAKIIGYFDKIKKVNIEFAFDKTLIIIMVSKIKD